MLLRGVPASARYLMNGGPHADSVYEGREFFGAEASSMTLGLVGLGNVGLQVAARAARSGSRCWATTRSRPAMLPAALNMVGFDELLSRSDIVSVHARATADNRHLFGPPRSAACGAGRTSSTPHASRWWTRRRCTARWPAAPWPARRSTWWNAVRRATAPAARAAERHHHPAHRRSHPPDAAPRGGMAAAEVAAAGRRRAAGPPGEPGDPGPPGGGDMTGGARDRAGPTCSRWTPAPEAAGRCCSPRRASR